MEEKWERFASSTSLARTGPSEVAETLSRRRFVQVGAGLASLAIGSGIVGACGSSDSEESRSDGQVTFGFSTPFSELPIAAIIKQMIRDIGEREGWKVLLDETQGGELQDQLSTLDTWITQKITAMQVLPIDPSAYVTTARRAVHAGVIWTSYFFPMKIGAGGILIPPELSGEVTGKATVDWINTNDAEAEVLILEIPTAGPGRERTDIPKKMLREGTNAKIVAVQPAHDPVKGLQVTESVLQVHPNVTVVIGHNDDGALGAANAFRKVGHLEPSKVFIIGQDGSKDALAALKNGDTYFRASAALDIRSLCEEVVEVTKHAIERGWKPGDQQEYVKLTPTLIEVGDTKNIDRFLTAYQ